MTGFGRHVEQKNNYQIAIEIKCLNSKSLDCQIKLPYYLQDLEIFVRTKLREIVKRGKLDILIEVKNGNLDIESKINYQKLRYYIKKLKNISEEETVHAVDLINAALRIPDVYEKEPETFISGDLEVSLKKAFLNALENLDQFRIKEGQEMELSIRQLINEIKNASEKLDSLCLERKFGIKNRLVNALSEIGDAIIIDNNRLEQELIYYLERLDIHEEIIRLKAHLKHFMETLENETECGRKLGFIAQEILREANTIGSKASHAEIQKIITEVKDNVEKIKEVLLNIL